MEGKFEFLGSAGEGYSVSEFCSTHHYGYVRKLESGKWGASKDKIFMPRTYLKDLPEFPTRIEAARYLREKHPHWVWEGGDTLLGKDFVGDVQRRDPEYAAWLMKKSDEVRASRK